MLYELTCSVTAWITDCIKTYTRRLYNRSNSALIGLFPPYKHSLCWQDVRVLRRVVMPWTNRAENPFGVMVFQNKVCAPMRELRSESGLRPDRLRQLTTFRSSTNQENAVRTFTSGWFHTTTVWVTSVTPSPSCSGFIVSWYKQWGDGGSCPAYCNTNHFLSDFL